MLGRGGVEQFHAHANFGAEAEEGRERSGNELGGNQEHQPVRQGNQAVVHDDVRLAGGVVGGDQVRAEAEFAAEFGGGRLFGKKGVGSAFKHRAAHDLTGERPAKPLARLEEGVLDGGICGTRFRKLVGSRQTRNAAANNRRPHASLLIAYSGGLKNFAGGGAGCHGMDLSVTRVRSRGRGRV